jgi:integrase
MLIREVVALYVEQLREEGRSWEKIGAQLKPILSSLGYRDSEDLTPRDLADYRTARGKQISRRGGLISGATINRELTYLHSALVRARDLELVTRVPRWRKVPENGRRYDMCTQEQFARLRHYLEDRTPVIADLIAMYFETGWRKTELLELRWEEISWEQQVIELPPARNKSHKPRIFPIQGRLEEILKRRWDHQSGPLVFHRDGRKIADFRRVWERAREQAGCPTLTIHGFRRSFATHQMEAGIPVPVTMALAGWKTHSIYERYAIVRQAKLREAVRRMREYREGGNGQGDNGSDSR